MVSNRRESVHVRQGKFKSWRSLAAYIHAHCMPTPDAAARSAVPTSARALASRAIRHAEHVAIAVHHAAFDTFAVSLFPPMLYCDFECLRLALLTTARANVEPIPALGDQPPPMPPPPPPPLLPLPILTSTKMITMTLTSITHRLRMTNFHALFLEGASRAICQEVT